MVCGDAGPACWPEQQKRLARSYRSICRGPSFADEDGEGVAVLCFGFILERLTALHTVCAPGCVETQDWLSELAS